MEAGADACNGWLNEAVFLTASVQFSWPPAISFLAATVQVLMTADSSGPHRQIHVELACVCCDWDACWRCVRNPGREVRRTGRLLSGRRLVQRGRSTIRLLACTEP